MPVTSRRLLSICVPSYARPGPLTKLLASIDCDPSEVEVVVCEDHSSARSEIRKVVLEFSGETSLPVHYSENPENYGYDGNLRRLIELAEGKFVMLIGDDDVFIPGALDRFIQYLKAHQDKKYFLRSYTVKRSNGQVEPFRYLPGPSILPRGVETVAWLFKRSVTLCGFTIARDDALACATSELDGSLLYQVYLMAQVCLSHDAAYCDIPIAQVIESYQGKMQSFGSSLAEKKFHTPGKITHDNSINFTNSYFRVTDYMDRRYHTDLTRRVRLDLSKYSYPFLSIQRKHGLSAFLTYARRLENETGIGDTWYFNLYKWALVMLGDKACDNIIAMIKRVYGRTPNF